MSCCEDASNQKELDFRNRQTAKKQKEPLKFRVLSFLGLKQKLIDRYVFVRSSNPKYQIERQGQEWVFKSKFQIQVPQQYEQEVRLIQDPQHSVYAISLNLKDRSKYNGTVIYSHGNSSDLSHSLIFITQFAKNFPKFDYVVYQYTGYGKTSQRPITQTTICQDLQLLIANIVPQKSQIILWGFSLGTYPTVKVAAKHKFKGIILQSPLASIYSLFTDNLSAYSTFDNDCFSILEHIDQITSFLVIFHSVDDQIVPFEHSKILFQKHRMSSSNPYCFLVEVTALKHNQMHVYLSSRVNNQVRETMHSYLKLMIESKHISKGKQLMIEKQKYLEDINKYKKVQRINIECKSIRQEEQQRSKEVRNSINFVEVKDQVTFQMDDITPQATVEISQSLQIGIKRHKQYMQKSQDARDQSEVSDIPAEERMHELQE